MNYFEENYDKVQFARKTEECNGLRNAQIGASHAIASFFTLKPNSTAIVVMPTGSGKTAVLNVTPFLVCARKVLVITPSKMVRSQIFEEFSELNTLINTNVLPALIHKPNVLEMEHRYLEDEKKKYDNFDVVVATPQCALSLVEDREEAEKFDCILIDEAHHTPAASWTKIIDLTDKAKHVLFTATPFRIDYQEIKGEMVYRYPLNLAYQDGIFGEILYIPIEESDNKDLKIAIKAEEVFNEDRAKGLEHYLMVRTATKDKAKELETLYKENTNLRLQRIDSSMTNSTVKSCIKLLRERKLDGIICVDMLGEGFDFPNLKIAAIHEVHKSLANTLQFIGRFARTNASNIGTAKFIAINDEELVIENRRLYSSDAVWQEIIIDISDRKVNQEVNNKEYINEYQQRSEKYSNENFSLFDVRPGCHAKIYKIDDFNLFASFPNSCNVIKAPYINKNENTVVAVGEKLVPPKWLASKEIFDIEHLLYIVHFQKKTGLLFILSQIKTENLYDEIAGAFSANYEKIPKSKMHRVLAELKNFEIFSSGMANRYAESGESYRISTGSDTSQAIDETTGKMYSAGHAFCKAISGDSEITIGYSSASKMWSSAYKPLKEYIQWCDNNGEKIVNDSLQVKTNTNYDLLPMPSKLEVYPENIFFINFSAETYISCPLIFVGEDEKPLCNLTDCTLLIKENSANKIKISMSVDDIEKILICDVDGHYCSADETKKITVYIHGERVLLEEYFSTYPLQFKATDDTVVQGDEILPGSKSVTAYNSNGIIEIDWENEYHTDITIEFNDKKHHPTGKSIQTSLREILEEDKENQYIIYDHGSGEMADYITAKINNNVITITLYHVKKKHGEYNGDVNDIYEVTSQAIKSIIWFKNKGSLIDKITSRRKSNHAKFIKGDYKTFCKDVRDANIYMSGRIAIVQPAISKSRPLPDKFQEILGATKYYVESSGKISELLVLGSS